MPRQPSAGSIHDERGSMLIITAAACLIFTLLFMGIAEYGRWLLTKEQTQTSADAAALAGSVSGIRCIVTLQVNDPIKGTFNLTGDERTLIGQGDWVKHCYSYGTFPCSYKVISRDIVYDENTARNAADKFQAMNPTQGDSKLKGMVVHGDKNDPYYPSVVVSVTTKLKTMFPGQFSDEYNIKTVSQGDTFFRDPATGKWSKAPPDATYDLY
jgi:hypothetical protein